MARFLGRLTVLVLGLTSVVVLSMPATAQSPSTQRDARVPAGFSVLDDTFWRGPWMFRENGMTRDALPRLHGSLGEFTKQPIPMRLDSGSTGAVRVEAGPCEGAECGPDDCGCFASDSYWIEVTNAAGQRVAHRHLWAAYGDFEIVPVDLVDGPGDELVIVRMPGRSAPPHGPDLKVWKLGPGLADLARPMRVAGYLGTLDTAIPCARWHVRLLVDPQEAKPRSIRLQAGLAAEAFGPGSVCRLDRAGAQGAGALKRGEVLRFQRGRYQSSSDRGVFAELLRNGRTER